MIPPATTADQTSAQPLYRYVLLLWLLITLAGILHSADRIAASSLGDPDNYMRLVQVRDWLAGQSWTDVVQHRMNPPHGGDIHWSRLVDMPIALIIILLRPFFGQPVAEMSALIAVPALLSLALMLVFAPLLRNIAGRGAAIALLALLPFCLFISAQFMPMRIDHHGWQILLAAVALVAWTRPGLAQAALAGLALAFWMHISIEGLPYAMLFGALYMMAYLSSGDRRAFVYLAALTAGSLLFLMSTHGTSILFASTCDAVSAPYVAALLLATFAFFAGDFLLRPARWQARLIPPLLAGGGALAGIAFVDPSCLAGPFVSLDPLTRQFWYLNVKEGLPFWRQSGSMALAVVIAPLPGILIAIVHGDRAFRERQDIIAPGIALAALFAWGLGLLVMRTGGVAQLYALPGMAMLIAWLSAHRAQFRPRLLWSLSMAAALLLATTLPALITGSLLFPEKKSARAEGTARSGPVDDCVGARNRAVFLGLGDRLVFAPIDAGPALLYRAKVQVVAGAYHRNSAAISTVIKAFTSAPGDARAIIGATGAPYLLVCPEFGEMKKYVASAPDGLAAALVRGDVPNWLEADPQLQSSSAKLYRVIR